MAMYEKLVKAKLAVAAQCCEHLNRVLIMTEEDAERFGYEIVIIEKYMQYSYDYNSVSIKNNYKGGIYYAKI